MAPGSYVPRFRRTEPGKPEPGKEDRARPHLIHAPGPVRKVLALDLLRRARKEVEDSPTVEEVVKAHQLFQRAVAANPDHALAQVGVAITSFWMQVLGCESPSSALSRAKAAALRAIELDPSTMEAHAVLGLLHSVYDHDFRAANAIFLRAARLNPESHAVQQARAMAYLAPMGHLAEAHEIITLVLKKDARSRFRFGLGWIRYLQRDWQSAVDELQKTLQVNPRFLLARFLLVFAHERLGQHEIASRIFNDNEMRTAYPLMAVRCQALSLLRAGRKNEAAAVARRMESEYATGSHEPMLAADVFAALGDSARAFEWLDRAVEDSRFWLIYLKSDPAFDCIRDDPRFAELLTRIGLGTAPA
jgi:tetratricopeptide (TPR) repeat protein